jgi:hypothetical protein
MFAIGKNQVLPEGKTMKFEDKVPKFNEISFEIVNFFLLLCEKKVQF